MGEQMLDPSSTKTSLSKHWFYGFMGRHKDLVMLRPQKLERARAVAQVNIFSSKK
jgi:hypothetical protein